MPQGVRRKKIPSGLIYVAIGTLFTLSLGLFNNFPYLYSDSTAYLSSGINLTIPWGRPIFYGLFLRMCHMRDNLYFCMIGQSTLLAVLLYIPFILAKPYKIRGGWYLITIIVLTLTTSWSFYANYLTADFFGIILFLSTWVLLFFPLRRLHTVILIVVLSYALLVHKSHFILFILTVLFYFILIFISKQKPISTKRALGITLSVLMLSISVSVLVQSSLKSNTGTVNGTLIFLTAKLNETGILYEFLHRKCEEKNYPLCAYQDSLPADFLWDRQSPRFKLDRQENDEAEYRRMLGDMVRDWRTVKHIIVMSFNSTLCQLFTFDIEPHFPVILNYIPEHFAVHRYDMKSSLQNRGNRWELGPLNTIQWVVVLISAFCLLFFALNSKFSQRQVRASIIFTLGFLFLNAWVFGTFAYIHTRFQGRVICLIPFMLLFWFPDVFVVIKGLIKEIMRSVDHDANAGGE